MIPTPRNLAAACIEKSLKLALLYLNAYNRLDGLIGLDQVLLCIYSHATLLQLPLYCVQLYSSGTLDILTLQ
jgi:hypothetical protein